MTPLSGNQDNLFDDRMPWGEFTLSGSDALLLRLCHALPSSSGMRRLALWLRHPLKHRLRGPVDAEIWGLKLRLMPSGNLSESRWLFMPQFIDRAEREFMRANLHADGMFVDIGANAGLYSFWAAGVCLGGGGHALAIEPDPELTRRLTFNRNLNELEHLEIVPHPLGDAESKAKLLIGGKNRGKNQVANSAIADADATEVTVKTLPGLLAEQGINHIDGLKIGIEGQEHRVMRHFFNHAPESLWPSFMIFETCTAAQAKSMQALAAEKCYSTVAKGRMNTVAKRTHSAESQK